MSTLLPPRPTLLYAPCALGESLGIDLWLASETLQYTGSFKYRAAQNVIANIPNEIVVAASSGNFAQAMAFACRQAGKRLIVVMPTTSSKVKIAGVQAHGATVDLLDVAEKTREARVAELLAEYPEAYRASAFDDPYVIEGNASLGHELVDSGHLFDAVLCPIGGGGLTSGLALAFERRGYATSLLPAEPAMANDAARTLASGQIEVNDGEPQTLADGARTRSIGIHNWMAIQPRIHEIIEVDEAQIQAGVRRLFLDANLKAEPTGALPIGAILSQPDRFRGQKVCAVISGGNVEPGLYGQLIGP